MWSRRRLFLIVTLIALGLRAIVLWNLEAYPRFENIRNRLDDQVVFDAWAKAIVAGEPFDYGATSHEFAIWAAQSPGVYPQAPLYPWFVALVYRLSNVSYDAVRAVQLALGAAAAGGVAVLASFFVSTPAALTAGLAAAFYGPLIFYETTFLRAGVFPAVGVFCLLLAVVEGRAPRRAAASARRSLVRRVGLGLLLGAGVLLRPTFLLVAVALAGWIVHRRGPRSVLPIAFALAATLFPVAVVNTLRSGSPAFLSSNGPYIFYVSNAHDAPGNSATPPPSYERLKAEKPIEEIDLFRATLDDIATHPTAWIRLKVSKLGYFFAPREGPNNVSYAMGRERNPALRIAAVEWWMIAPWALFGALVGLRRWRETLPLYLFVASYVAGTVAFYVLGRLRQPAMLILVVFAALALDQVLRELRSRRRRAAVLLIVLSAATLAFRPGPPQHRSVDYLMASAASFTRAIERGRDGDSEGARTDLVDALVLNPSHAEARSALRTLGTIVPPRSPAISGACEEARRAFEAGRKEKASGSLRALTREAPLEPLPWRYLANLAYLTGDLHTAQRALEEALRRDPLNGEYGRSLEAVRREILAGSMSQSQST